MMRQYLGLMLLAALFVVSQTLPLDSDEVEKISNCKDLCGKCNCLGFYCGEECLCECDGEGEEDGECINKMQETCERLKMPFEVLIQGNTGNRLVRSLFAEAARDNEGECIAKDPKSRLTRNTISIYKPKASLSYESSDNLKEVQHLVTELEEDLNSLKRKRDTNAAPPPEPEPAPAPPGPPAPEPPAPPAPAPAPPADDPSVGVALEQPFEKKFLTQKELIAASLDSLNKKLLGDIAANKVILAKQADDIKLKMSAVFEDVKLKATKFAPTPTPTATPSPPAASTVATVPTPVTVPAFDLSKIELKKLDFSKLVAKPDAIVGSPLIDIDAIAEQAKQGFTNIGESLSNLLPKIAVDNAAGPIVQPAGTI